MKTTTGYYDAEIGIDMLPDSSTLSDYFYLQDLKQRKLYIEVDIDQTAVSEIVHHILQYNREDAGLLVEERQPILLYLVSRGGDVEPGFELIDAIEASITPVYTINLGYQYSMGFLIGLAGHKRFGTKNSTYLMHDGSNLIYNSGAKASDQAEFNRRIEQRIRSYVISHTRITPEEYDDHYRVEWYMFADEAKAAGVIDSIIGLDCVIDAII